MSHEKMVEISAHDLEVLLCATAIPNQMERLMRSLKTDPQVLDGARKIGVVFDRCTIALNQANREDEYPDVPWNGLDPDALSIIRRLRREATVRFIPNTTIDTSLNDALVTLRKYGLIEVGDEVPYSNWPSGIEPAAPATGACWVRLTKRGRDLVETNL